MASFSTVASASFSSVADTSVQVSGGFALYWATHPAAVWLIWGCSELGQGHTSEDMALDAKSAWDLFQSGSVRFIGVNGDGSKARIGPKGRSAWCLPVAVEPLGRRTVCGPRGADLA